MKRSFLLCISFILFLISPQPHAAEAAKSPGRETTSQEILILNSYHPGYRWSDDEQAGIIDVLRGKDRYWLPVIEYLDLKRLPDGRHLAELKNVFRRKYRDQKFSVIITIDNPALEFAINNQAELFENAPIVFCGISNYTPSLLKKHPNVTGITESIDLAGTIEMMLRLHPATREIFIPLDYTVSNLAVRKELEALAPRFSNKIRFRFTEPLTMEELLKESERLPKNSLVLALGFITDKSGRTFRISETNILLSEHSPVPVYSTYEHRLGFGIVGGKLLNARIHGSNAGRVVLRVLAGEKASAIPVVLKSDSQFMFDFNVMNRFGIPLSVLPAGSVVINKPVSFYAAHRVIFQTALGIIIFLAIVIFLLTINIIQRRRSAIALQASETKYYDLYENAPDMYLSLDAKTATIINCNNTLVRTIGYAREDIIGRSIIEISHPDSKEDIKKLFQQFTATGEIRDAEFTIMRKDGTMIDVNSNVSAVRDKAGKITHSRSIWRDVTDRKKAEIRLARLNDCFLQFGVSPDDNINRLVAVCGELMNATCALYNRLGKNLLCSVGQWRTPAGFKSEDKPHGHICYDVIQQGAERPLLVRNLQESHYARTDPNILPYGLQTYLGMVVKWKQTAVGALCVVYQNDIIPSNDDLRFMTIIASAIAVEEDRQRIEAALSQSEENFRRFLEESPLGIRVVTADGETIYANQAILNIYGYGSLEDLNATPIKKRYTPESYAEFQIRWEKRKRGDYNPSEYEVSIVKKDGEVRHLQVFRKEILWNGKSQFQLIYQDITERRLMEQALKGSEERYRRIVETSLEGIWIIDEEFRTTFVNQRIADMLGYTPEEIMGRRVDSFIFEEDREDYAAKVDARRRGLGETFERRFRCQDGATLWNIVSSTPILDDAGRFRGAFSMFTNITERKRAEDALRSSQRQLRAFAERLQAVREEERTTIAREIHDELGGALTGLKIDFSLLTRAALKIGNKTAGKRLLDEMNSMLNAIDSTIQIVRRIAMELRPGILDDIGLAAALEWQLKDFEKRTGIRCEYFQPVREIDLEADLSTALFRIFQEALTNVVRHSGATEVAVRFHQDADGFTLEVKDNGKGIEKENIMGKASLGLLGMRERAQVFGGRIIVTGTPGRGTTVTVEIPPGEKRKMYREQEELNFD